MKVEKIKFTDTNLFHPLISDYLTSNENLKSSIRDFGNLKAIGEYIKIKEFGNSQRETLVKVINSQYLDISRSPEVSSNLKLLLEPNTYTITTGHQLCLATGPFYFIVKICSTISLCERLNNLYPDKNFVPIYWMASEDHDFDEIDHFQVFNKTFNWDSKQEGAVGRMTLENINELLKEVDEQLGDSFSGSELATIIRNAYSKKTLAEATRTLVDKLFNEYGLIIIDGDDHKLKSQFIPIMEDELFNQSTKGLVDTSIDQLKKSAYKIQVNPREINLFYLGNNSRTRIIKNGDDYSVSDSSVHWTKAEIINELHKSPENFSPNVILRPLYQELILPNLAYIGGAGEISYWLELKASFDYHQIDLPLLFVRDSVVPLNKTSLKKINKLSFSKLDLFKSIDELNKMVIPQDELIKMDIYRNDIVELYFKLRSELSELDPSLGVSVDSEQTKTLKGIENLDKKMVRSLKRKNEELLNHVKNIKEKLFPDGGLQERQTNYIQFHLEFGEELIPFLINNLNPLEREISFISND